MNTWQLHDAKNRFSTVVDAALTGESQQVTRRGKPVVVGLALTEYERLCRSQPERTPDFVEHLLAILKAPDADAFELPSPNQRLQSRENHSLRYACWAPTSSQPCNGPSIHPCRMRHIIGWTV